MKASYQELLFKAMASPDFYPHPVQSVTLKETHISKVFLTGKTVYKIKKAVDLGFLDFSTLSKRRRCCELEVALNRRLSQGIYLGVVPIIRSGSCFSLSGSGEVIEYAVRMRQLPDHRLMAAKLEKDRVAVAQVEALAHRLTDFFERQGCVAPEMAAASWGHVRSACEENFRQTRSASGVILNSDQYRAVLTATRSFLEYRKDLFDSRIERGKIYNGHGDLRTGHIYFDGKENFQIIDCIEFSSRLRQIDIASDLAFLSMDLDVRGATALSDALLDVYVRRTHDWQVYAVMPFYKCYRAMVRCKVNCIHLRENTISRKALTDARNRAEIYLAFAYRYARQFAKPTLWVVCGLPGAGKSTLTRALAETLLIDPLRSDVIRKQYFERHPQSIACGGLEQALYSPEAHRLTYTNMLLMARAGLERKESVILDATFSEPEYRRNAVDLAGELNCRIVFAECTAPPHLLKARLAQREGGSSASDARLHHYELLNRRYAPLEDIEPEFRIRVKTERSIQDCIRSLLARHYTSGLTLTGNIEQATLKAVSKGGRHV